jgi:type II pantothenate kinase
LSRENHSAADSDPIVGVDVGATLTKVAVRSAAGAPDFQSLPSVDLDAVVAVVNAFHPTRAGLTGGGAAALDERLSLDTARVGEFDAWGRGAAQLLGAEAEARYLLVSVGTGTSIMLADGGKVFRIGGPALGGGTLLGLGNRLAGAGDFAALCSLASRGDRFRVDLSVADVYSGGETPPLAAELTASAFAKLAAMGADDVRPEDLARALIWMVGENVALIAGGLSAAAGVEGLVFCGSTLRKNPVLAEALTDILGRFGRRSSFLADGEFGAALGALLVAEEREASA